MKRMLLIGTAVFAACAFQPLAAEAARCKQGQIYRPSLGVCQSKASAIAQGVHRPRYTKRAHKYRVRLAARQRPTVARVEPIQRPTRSAPPIPKIDSMFAPESIVDAVPIERSRPSEEFVRAEVSRHMLQQELWMHVQKNRSLYERPEYGR